MPLDVSNCAALAIIKHAINSSMENKAEWARCLGITKQHLWNILNGKSISDVLKKRLSDVFGFAPSLWFESYAGSGTVADIEVLHEKSGPRPGALGGKTPAPAGAPAQQGGPP